MQKLLEQVCKPNKSYFLKNMSSTSVFRFIFTILAIFVLACGAEPNYCKISKEHTMCIYKEKSATPGVKISVSSLDSSQIKRILDHHNKLRLKVKLGEEKRGLSNQPQPAAKNMPKMVWNKELAIIAQRWANQTTTKHDSCRNIARFEVGQNIAWVTNMKETLEQLIDGWYNEVKDFDPNNIDPFKSDFSHFTLHYSQMLWAKTTNLGCGFVTYQNKEGKTDLLVCNYGPKGNMNGETMYKKKVMQSRVKRARKSKGAQKKQSRKPLTS